MPTTTSAGDTAWILACTALIFLMIPGLALFYSGLLRKQNIQSIPMLCFTMTCLVTLQWILFGYSLSFGPDHNGWIGTFAWAGLRDVGADPNLEYAGTIPHLAFMFYRGMVAAIAPILFLTPFAERVKGSALCLLAFLWTTLVYDPVIHWVWATGGFLRSSGVLDFAGGVVVYVNAGIAALAMMLVLRKSRPAPHPTPSSSALPLAIVGAGLLWVGEFGFVSGNALTSGDVAVNALIMTQIAATAAGLVWSLLDKLTRQKLTPLGILTGVVTGLVAISPAAGYINIVGALGIGIGAAVLCYISLALLQKTFGYEDTFFTVSLFGIGGLWGVLATGLWATKSVNPAGADGFFYGNPVQLLIQIKTALAISLYSFAMTWILIKFVEWVVGLHVSEEGPEVI